MARMTDAPFVSLRAFAVHVFTASGVVLGFLALMLATGRQWSAMFSTLGIALLVDGLDGPMARWFRVAEVLPRWSGETLDVVVDFVTYVFVPAYAIAASGLMPDVLAIVSGAVICFTGALYFADREMKTEDHYFRGFPAVWNLAAFYLFLVRPPAWLSAPAVFLLAASSFLGVRFLHPLRVVQRRWFHVSLLAAWGLLAVDALAADLFPRPIVIVLLLAIAVYFFAAGLLRRRI